MKEVNHLILTNDGSSTLKNDRTGDLYHSIHGAETESNYVFIDKGLNYLSQERKKISILEIGLGTGLNALLSFIAAKNLKIKQLKYTSLEPFPIEENLIKSLNFKSLRVKNGLEIFNKIHGPLWGDPISIDDSMEFLKHKIKLQNFETFEQFDLIYFDAFGPLYQPEMWEKEVTDKLVKMLKSKGVLVTFCAQGKFRRDLLSFGLQVERLPGPPGKREMLRATNC